MAKKFLNGIDLGGVKGVNAAKGTAATDLAVTGQLPADWVSAVGAGADPTGTTAIDTIVNGLISGLPSTGGTIYLGAGTFKVSTGLTASLAAAQTVTIRGAGASATTLLYYGSGDAVRMYNPSAPGSGGAESYFSGVRDLTIDGTHATGSPVGLHAGDITFLQLQGLMIQNFTGTSSIGLHLDNTVSYTEEADIRAAVANCTQGTVLDVSGTGYNSYGYSNLDLTFFQAGAQSCLCVLNGALLYHSAVRVRGDVNGSSSALSGNPAVIVVEGAGPGGTNAAGGSPGITACHLDVLVEPNDLSGTATHFMQTLYLDTTNFGFLAECYGLLDFAQGTGSFAPVSTAAMAGNGNNFTGFSGVIAGDSNLNPSGTAGWAQYGNGSIMPYLPGYTNFNGYFPTQFADVFSTVLQSSDTVHLNYSGIGNGDTLPGPQRKLMYIQQPASGGPYTLTWPSTGSPTTASPTVVWNGGSAPALNTAASGVTVVDLVTYDGVTWYGTQLYPAAGGSGFSNPMAATGDMIYGGTSGAATQLSGNTTTTKKYLTQTGTGSASAAPGWNVISSGDVPTLNQSTTGNAATATNLAGGATLPAYVAPKASSLTFGTTIAVNAALGNAFNLTLTASTGTISNPTNPVDGEVIRFRVSQDSTGSRTVAWGTAYDFGSVSAPTLSTGASKVDVIAFEYVSSLSKWCYLGAGLGY